MCTTSHQSHCFTAWPPPQQPCMLWHFRMLPAVMLPGVLLDHWTGLDCASTHGMAWHGPRRLRVAICVLGERWDLCFHTHPAPHACEELSCARPQRHGQCTSHAALQAADAPPAELDSSNEQTLLSGWHAAVCMHGVAPLRTDGQPLWHSVALNRWPHYWPQLERVCPA